MAYDVAVIGGGWYGCHIAASLRSLGFRITLFEQHHRLLHGASGNNQFRLHLGFHYPRHYTTRMQSRDGFARFVERYPELSRPVADNIYAVPLGDSVIDFLTYRIIMTSSGVDFTELTDVPPGLIKMDGYLKVAERVLLTGEARRYFANRLGDDVVLDHRIASIRDDGSHVWVDGKRFDFAVDATWGHHRKPPIDMHYEPTILLYYEARAPFPAITMVDGPLCAIYPTEDPAIYTLSSVPHTPLGRHTAAGAACRALLKIDTGTVAAKQALMEEQISRYVPAFRDNFRFVGPQLAVKSKPTGASDDRSCHVYRDGRVFSVMSGKIDTIFFAVERILSMLEATAQSPPPKSAGRMQDVTRDQEPSWHKV